MALHTPTKETIWLDKWIEQNHKGHFQLMARRWLVKFSVTDEDLMDQAAIEGMTKEMDEYFSDWGRPHDFVEDILDEFIGSVDFKEIASWWLDQELEAIQSEGNRP